MFAPLITTKSSPPAETLAKKPKIVSLTPNCLTDVLSDVSRVGEATGNATKRRHLSRDSNSGFRPCASELPDHPPVPESLASNGSIRSTLRVIGCRR